MAIAFRSVGTRTKVDTSVTGTAPSVALPAGHVANDVLIMPVFMDDNTGTTTPSGWTRLFTLSAGTSTNSPYAGWSHCTFFYRVDNGSVTTPNLNCGSGSWPNGQPYVLAWIAAYSGCDTTNPIGEWSTSTTQSSTAAQAHPQITTALANCWLLTLRGVGSDSQRTFTESVGTDVERVDDWTGFTASPSAALYDSNAALSTGLQTQRTTTASGTVGYGSTMASIVLRPAAVATGVVAPAGVATIVMAAKTASVTTVNGPWNACGDGGMPVYSIAVDWANNGNFTDTGDNITSDELSGGTAITYGRDQSRQLSPGAAGSMALDVVNVSRKYSPENVASVLFGNLDPARNVQAKVTFQGSTSYLFTGRIDDFDINADFDDRTVKFTFLDSLALLNGIKLSTPLYQTVRTGEVIDIILDAAGWTGPRDLDHGATVIPYWWAEGTDAFSAIQDIVRSEGPPAIAYQSPDGTFIFRDRHHRLQRSSSSSSQARFAAPKYQDCTASPVTGLDFTPPFVYSNGWKDIINSVSLDVDVRQPDLDVTAVWSSSDTISLSNGESRVIEVSGGDPFMNAVTPVAGTDFTLSGAGSVLVQLSRTSGASASITLTAVGGAVQVISLQLRAQAVRVASTVKVTLQDGVSIGEHGQKDYPDSIPWAGVNDAFALATLIIQHYSERLPIVQLRVSSKNPYHWQQVVGRTIGDRITIQHDELGLNADFFIESVTHQIDRIWTDRPPVHSVIFGCEKCPDPAPSNPFTFDKRGAGFDQGLFDPVTGDDPLTIWIWDDPIQGTFDGGLFAT